MSLRSKLAKQAALSGEALRRMPWRQLIAARRRTDAEVVVWLHHQHPDPWWRWLANGDTALKDVALLKAVAATGCSYRVVTGPRIGGVTNSTIVYSINSFNPAGLADHSAGLRATLRALEAQGNTLYPSADEAEFWENKVFMHRRFDELGVRSPRTVAVTPTTDLDAALAAAGLDFPLLVKEPHSCNGRGLHLVDDAAALETVRAELAAEGGHQLLVQELLDMRRDLRVTLVGGRIVHHYWRVNESDEWKPTTTRGGSRADFVTFPEAWRERIEATVQRLGLRNAAFDVCWAGDDLDTEPYFLEVSPGYTPNPPPPPAYADRPYRDFTQQLTGPDSYARRAADLLEDLHLRVVEAWGLARR